VIDLSADPHFFTRHIQFRELTHEVGDQPPVFGGAGSAQRDWGIYVTHTNPNPVDSPLGATTSRGMALDKTTGNEYVTGWVEASSGKVGFVAKFDPTGHRLWRTTFDAIDHDPFLPWVYIKTEAHAIAVDQSGNAYVTGDAQRTLLGTPFNRNAFAMKLDADGHVVTSYGIAYGSDSSFDDHGNGIAVIDSGPETGRVVVTGDTRNPRDSSQTVIIWGKLNADGVSWAVGPEGLPPGQGYTDDGGNAITLDPATSPNAFKFSYIAGWIIPVSGDKDVFVVKVNNANGSPDPSQGGYAYTSAPNLGDDQLYGIAVDDQSQVYAAGILADLSNPSVPSSTGLVVKVDATGTTPLYSNDVWRDSDETLFTKTAYALSLNKDTGEVFITGSFEDPRDTPPQHAYTVEYTADGKFEDKYEMIPTNGVDIGYGNAFFHDPNGLLPDTVYATGSTTSSTGISYNDPDSTTFIAPRDGFLTEMSRFGPPSPP
jgi:hypothetical protein